MAEELPLIDEQAVAWRAAQTTRSMARKCYLVGPNFVDWLGWAERRVAQGAREIEQC